MIEEWRDIKGFEDLYQVSNTGKIKCLNYNHTKKEKILKTGKASYNTLRVGLYKDKKQKTLGVAKIVYETFTSNKLKGNEMIRYRDGNTCNCSLSNLYVETKSQVLLKACAEGRKFAKKYEYYGKYITMRDMANLANCDKKTIRCRLEYLKWNSYETVEVPLNITNTRKEKMKKWENVN